MLCFFFAASTVHALQVTLAWDASSEPDLAGYKVYYGTSTGNYSISYDAGNVNSYVISDLEAGNTYYFAATAYDQYGNESNFSNEVTYIAAGANSSPVAQNGVHSTNEDTPGSGVLTATDPDGDTLIYSITAQGAIGTVAINDSATGSYTYTPNAGVSGSDSFTFEVIDSAGLTATASVTVTILPINDAPVAQAGTLYTIRGTSRSGVLVATDADGDVITYTIASQGNKGKAIITNASTGAYTYTPDRGSKGQDSFTFQVADPGGLTTTATIAVRIIALGNNTPVAGSGTVTTIQDTPISGSLSAADEDGDALGYQIVSAPTLGALSLNAETGAFTYAPNANTTGTDTFTFKANDGNDDSNVASFNVIINAHVRIVLEAETGSLSAPMVLGKNTKASGGKYIWVPNGKGNISDPLSVGGEAVYSFSVPTSGTYRVWARVIANNVGNNSFFVSMDYGAIIAWHTALGGKKTWIWDQTKGQKDPNAASFYLEAGTHTLAIKQMEDGTKLDSILITTQSGWIPETVYCDAENGDTDGWEVFDAAPAGALISSVFDEDRASYVIELSGSRKENGYRLRSENLSNWANKSQFVIEWSMKYDENFVIFVEVQTTSGSRYLQYEPIIKDHLGDSSRVRLGLGTGANDGEWHTFVRDLQVDLIKAQEDVQILQVNSFAIRGSGMVDDIKLRESI